MGQKETNLFLRVNKVRKRNKNIVVGIVSMKVIAIIFLIQIIYGLSILLSDFYFLFAGDFPLAKVIFSGIYVLFSILCGLIWWTVALDLIGPAEEKEEQDYL